MTEYVRPTSLAEAVAARAEHADWTVLAGGTDLMVSAYQTPAPVGVIDVFGLGELVGICEAEDGLVIGAATTYADILNNELAAAYAPALIASAREIGAAQIQSRGTIGGNMATSSPVGDTLPVWLALDVQVRVVSVRGERVIPYDQFCTGYRQIALEPDELIASIRIPTRMRGAVQQWRKVGTRRAQSISKAMVAAAATVEDGAIAWMRFGLGAVADRPVRCPGAEQAAAGKPPTAETADAVRRAVLDQIQPIDDVRSTAQYRAEVTANIAGRFVLALADSGS